MTKFKSSFQTKKRAVAPDIVQNKIQFRKVIRNHGQLPHSEDIPTLKASTWEKSFTFNIVLI